MCGRYASSSRPEDLVEEFEVVENVVARPLAPDFNMAPTKEAYVVLERPPRQDGEVAHPAARQLRTLRWGLVPSWAKQADAGPRLVNARVETAAEKPSFRKPFRARRCIVPADGYYEWYVPQGSGTGAAKKQPYFIRNRDTSRLAMAGLYEIWRDPQLPPEHPDPYLWTFTVLTTAAIDELAHVHDRMPVLLTPERFGPWLDPTLDDVATLRSLLTPTPAGTVEAFPVSRAVGNVRNNGPHLIDPLPVEEDGTPVVAGQLSLLPEEES